MFIGGHEVGERDADAQRLPAGNILPNIEQRLVEGRIVLRLVESAVVYPVTPILRPLDVYGEASAIKFFLPQS